ncbi:hypothetical protein KZP23_21635 [Echinicola marina]|uniref:terpene synthase family protein n=1 Tax=Echinicola marina TaxID=2859768 RepID=UPI001CF6ACC9|nr:hypothetical protein [Echinicola marina]UCS93219.1 hypothetical protein KZP23_21635 [Echinicola marina]
MKKVTYLRDLKSMLDPFQWIAWERYLLVQDFISFHSYRKMEVIRSERRKDMYILLVMKGMAGMSLHGKLKKVFSSPGLVLDRSNYQLDKMSPFSIEALEKTMIASVPVAEIKNILGDMPDFKVLYEKLYAAFEKEDDFWNSLNGIPYGRAISIIRGAHAELEPRLTKNRFAELVGVSAKTISRYDELRGNKELRIHQTMMNILGFRLMRNSNRVAIQQSMSSWGSFFSVFVDANSSRVVERMNLAYMVSFLFPRGDQEKIIWSAKLIMLLTSIDVYMYQIPSGDGRIYWKKIRKGLHCAISGKDFQSPIPRLMAYYSAMKDLVEEAFQKMDAEVWAEIRQLVEGYIEERGWKVKSTEYVDKTDLVLFQSLRQSFSEGLLCMQLLKWVAGKQWQVLNSYHEGLEKYMLKAVRLVSLSNEILVTETDDFWDLPHNLVNLLSRIHQTNKQEALSSLWDDYHSVLDSMKIIKTEIFMGLRPKDTEKIKDFLLLVEAQVGGWVEWYGKVLVSNRNKSKVSS